MNLSSVKNFTTQIYKCNLEPMRVIRFVKLYLDHQNFVNLIPHHKTKRYLDH